MAAPIIFSGNDAKLLKTNLDFFGNNKILTGSVDPTSVATSANPGSLYLNNSTGIVYRKNDTGLTTGWSAFTVGGVTAVGAVGSSPNANGASVSAGTLTLQPADATNPGVTTAIAQTFGGIKTFAAQINADAGLDRSTSGTLSIGTSANSTIINIGNSSATVNIQGTTIYENTPQILSADPLITLNHGGAGGSGQNSGIEVEEGGSITGYAETSADRNSWIFKAPNTAGIATITPGASGITLDQSSHNPVTLTAVGSSPNANAASLSTQALTLQPADATNPGVITAGTQTFGGNKTFNNNLVVVGSTTLATTLTGVLHASSGVVSASNVDLTSEVTGVLPVANGGTNSNTTLNNNRIIVSSGGKIVEAAALTNGQLLIGSTGAAPVAASLSAGAGITITPGAGSITIASSSTGSPGDLSETTFAPANNQAVAANVTGLAFSNAVVRSAEVQYSVFINATTPLYEAGKLTLIQKAAAWELTQTTAGDVSGIVFTITNAGQVQYTSSNYTGFTAAKLQFRALTTSV